MTLYALISPRAHKNTLFFVIFIFFRKGAHPLDPRAPGDGDGGIRNRSDLNSRTLCPNIHLFHFTTFDVQCV